MAYYKVVQRLNGKLVSALVPPEFEALHQVYRDANGDFPIAKHGMVFDNLYAARRFAKHSIYTTEIWECTGKKDKLPKRSLTMGYLSEARIKISQEVANRLNKFLWFGKKSELDSEYIIYGEATWPAGTVRLRNIKLIKQVF